MILPAVKPYEVMSYIEKFDVGWLVYPDILHYRFKMSPMKAVEYMALDKPVIASDFPSLHELLGEAGFYVNQNDQKSITKVLRKLYTDRNKPHKKNNPKILTWQERQSKVLEKLSNVT